MSRVVLDASAVLALLNDEMGAGEVEASLPKAVMSTVNLAEVASTLIDAGMPPEKAAEAIAALGIDRIAFDDAQAFRAAALRPATRSLGLSLADRACLALGDVLGGGVLTADRTWSKLDLGIGVRQIR